MIPVLKCWRPKQKRYKKPEHYMAIFIMGFTNNLVCKRAMLPSSETPLIESFLFINISLDTVIHLILNT